MIQINSLTIKQLKSINIIIALICIIALILKVTPVFVYCFQLSSYLFITCFKFYQDYRYKLMRRKVINSIMTIQSQGYLKYVDTLKTQEEENK